MRAIEALPTHRDLAFQLGLSVQIVSRAYEELTRLDVIAGEVGRGTFVRAGPVETRTPWHRIGDSESVIDCSMLMPVRSDIHGEHMREALAGLGANLPPETLFSFRPRAAFERHGQVAVRWLARCGVAARADAVIPTNGSTTAVTVALMTAAKPGDCVATEELGHRTVPPLVRYLGLSSPGWRSMRKGSCPTPSQEPANRAG